MHREREIINATPEPRTRQGLARGFRALGVEPGMTVLAHSSLASLGWVCGGPVAVVQALMDAVSPVGTLVMPAHSGNLSEPSNWRNPPVPENGVRVWKTYDDLESDSDEDFPVVGELFEREHPIRKALVGSAECRLIPQKPLVDFAAAWFNNRSKA